MDPPQRDSVSNTQGTRRLRARKSIAHMPSPERTLDKENNVQELARSTQETKQQISTNTSKKSRSKSLGPGGLDALKDTSGNRRKVGQSDCLSMDVDTLTVSSLSLSRNQSQY